MSAVREKVVCHRVSDKSLAGDPAALFEFGEWVSSCFDVADQGQFSDFGIHRRDGGNGSCKRDWRRESWIRGSWSNYSSTKSSQTSSNESTKKYCSPRNSDIGLIRVNVNNYMKKQLARNLQARVLNGYLNLELDEMKDTYTGLFFNRASYVAKDSLSIFERQLGIFRDITSILTRIAALKNLASRKSWPILFLTALLPMLDTLLDKLFPGLKRRECTIPGPPFSNPIAVAPYESETDSERHGRHALRSLLQMSSTLKSRPEILIFGARDWILQKFHSTIHSINVSTDRESARSARRRAEYSGKWWELTTRLKQHFLPMTQGAARALLYLVVAYQPDYFGMPISQLTFVEGCVSDLFFSTTKLKNVISDKLVRDMFEVRNLFECVDYKSKSSSPANPREYVSRAGGMKVEVRGLSFAYREGKNVLKDVNFVIEPGQIVSIVGYNGSGSPHVIPLT